MEIKIDASDLLNQLDMLDERARKVDDLTVRDMKRRVPGAVSAATASVYRIKKSEVASCSAYAYDYTGRGRNAGKAHVRTSFQGTTIASFAVVFKGRKHAEWKTTPKRRPKTKITVRKNGVRRRVPKPYKVTVETFRGKPAVIKGKNGNRVFVVDGRNRAFVVGKSNRPMVHASTSVPQAITNKKVKAIWMPKLNRDLESRFYHHFNRLMR
ncbi:hypothetical protein CXU17_12040 [Akkermansia muciniphila]|nr:hypothetical protein CXU17_12040 [Akkermansia muciniphila]